MPTPLQNQPRMQAKMVNEDALFGAGEVCALMTPGMYGLIVICCDGCAIRTMKIQNGLVKSLMNLKNVANHNGVAYDHLTIRT